MPADRAVNRAVAFVARHGVVLASARGPVPSVAEWIAKGPIKGSWWAHPRGKEIFRALQEATHSDDVLVCRLVNGKVTLVHRRLWPALVRLAERFPRAALAQVEEEHLASGRHEVKRTAFPKWVPANVQKSAGKLSEAEALRALGDWVGELATPT